MKFDVYRDRNGSLHLAEASNKTNPYRGSKEKIGTASFVMLDEDGNEIPEIEGNDSNES